MEKQKNGKSLRLSEFIRERAIKSYTGFLAIAGKPRTASQMDAAEFFFNPNKRLLHELINKTCQMESAK